VKGVTGESFAIEVCSTAIGVYGVVSVSTFLAFLFRRQSQKSIPLIKRTITAAPAPTPPARPAETFEGAAAGVGAVVMTTTRGLVDIPIVLVGDAVVDGGGVGPGAFRLGGSAVVELTIPMPA